MVYSDEFLENLPEYTTEAGLMIVNTALDFFDRVGSNEFSDVVAREGLIEVHAVINAFLEARGLNQRIPGLSSASRQNVELVVSACQAMKKTWRTVVEKDLHANIAERSAAIFSKSFRYEFTDGDLARIQTLVNELRDLISNSEQFDANHQRRLLNRLERLQAELHKKMSDLDHFWGLVGDAGVAIGKFGKDAKPIVDRFREIVDIIWRTQSRAEQLPSGFEQPLLEPPKKAVE